MLLDELDGAQDGLRDWWGSGQKVGLGVEAVLVGGVDHLDGNALGRGVAVGAASVVPSLALLLDLEAARLLDVEGVGAVGVLVGQELGDGVIVEGGGQGASQECGDEELSVKGQGSYINSPSGARTSLSTYELVHGAVIVLGCRLSG